MCDNAIMRFKLGLIIGIAIGFALGAHVGKERYDRIVQRIRAIMQSDGVAQVVDAAERSTRKTRAAAGSGLVSAAETVRNRAAN